MVSDIAAASGPTQVVSALKRASASTGAGFDFLMKMAARESSMNPTAKAGSSSAAGLFQFIDQTWLGAVKQYGERHGLSDFASDITQDTSGRYAVKDASRREEILNLRFNADLSSAMAGELSNANANYLKSKIGRAASSADLYTAHFLGPAGAVKLLSAAANTKAADLLPQAARANVNVFYDGERAKTVAEVIGSIAKSMDPSGGHGGAKEIVAAPTHDKIQPSFRSVDILSTLAAAPAAVADPAQASLRAVTHAPTIAPSRFANMAYSIMQALDPTHLTSGRDDNSSRNER